MLFTGCSCTSSSAVWSSWCSSACIRSWSLAQCVHFTQYSHKWVEIKHHSNQTNYDQQCVRAGTCISLVIIQDLWPFLFQRKRVLVKVETGTGGMNDVDISWIPQETLNVMSELNPCFNNLFFVYQFDQIINVLLIPVCYHHQVSQLNPTVQCSVFWLAVKMITQIRCKTWVCMILNLSVPLNIQQSLDKKQSVNEIMGVA